MKLVYAVDKNSYSQKDHIGVRKKVASMIEYFNKCDISSTLNEYTWEGGYPTIEVSDETDILYFRRIEPSVKLILKFRELKSENKKLRLIMEIPTYPFYAENKSKVSVKRKISNIFGEILLRKYVDLVVIASPNYKGNKIYGIPVITISNGIDYSKTPLIKYREREEKKIHMICVSGCYFWHGYDRLIKGMADYYKENHLYQVFLHIVGDGPCLQEYKDITSDNDLNSYVNFYGNKVGDELDEVFDKADIAIDVLAAHRKKIYYASSLKSKEYVAKGLPIMTSLELDIDEDKNCKYIKYLPVDDSNICVKDIILFYEKMYLRGEDNEKLINKAIRDEFYQKCDWEFVLQPLIAWIIDKY